MLRAYDEIFVLEESERTHCPNRYRTLLCTKSVNTGFVIGRRGENVIELEDRKRLQVFNEDFL